MAVKDALAPIKATNCIDISFEKAVIKAVRQIYADMAASAGIQSVTLSGDFDPIDNTKAEGDLILAVDNTDPQNPVLNLTLQGA